MRDYVLPDYTHIKRGFIRPLEETTGKAKGNEQVCNMSRVMKKTLFFAYAKTKVQISCMTDQRLFFAT